MGSNAVLRGGYMRPIVYIFSAIRLELDLSILYVHTENRKLNLNIRYRYIQSVLLLTTIILGALAVTGLNKYNLSKV